MNRAYTSPGEFNCMFVTLNPLGPYPQTIFRFKYCLKIQLIKAQDTFGIVEDQYSLILVIEVASK